MTTEPASFIDGLRAGPLGERVDHWRGEETAVAASYRPFFSCRRLQRESGCEANACTLISRLARRAGDEILRGGSKQASKQRAKKLDKKQGPSLGLCFSSRHARTILRSRRRPSYFAQENMGSLDDVLRHTSTQRQSISITFPDRLRYKAATGRPGKARLK